jgi:hypothetical protein
VKLRKKKEIASSQYTVPIDDEAEEQARLAQMNENDPLYNMLREDEVSEWGNMSSIYHQHFNVENSNYFVFNYEETIPILNHILKRLLNESFQVSI